MLYYQQRTDFVEEKNGTNIQEKWNWVIILSNTIIYSDPANLLRCLRLRIWDQLFVCIPWAWEPITTDEYNE